MRCGITDIDVLTIDHIKGGGSRHKKEIGGLGYKLYAYLIKENFPKGYQVLCFNCNFKKSVEEKRNVQRLTKAD